mgnify:FL=1
MAAKTGSLSINSENIFPIIKKWLYSDHDIFYRELISNGCDAITKLKKLALMGEYEEPGETEYKIQVTVNSEDKTITVEDNGIGMPENIREQIFSAFFTTKPVGEGTGLGLSITRSIIEEKHDGKIEVESKEGEFTRFIFLIPLTK